MANQIKIIELDEALCKKLALEYGSDPSSLTVKEISTLEFCLALTLGQRPDTVSPATPGGLIIRSQSPSNGPSDITPAKKPEGLIVKEPR